MDTENADTRFSSPQDRQAAIDTLEDEIQRLMGEIERGYSHLGRRVHAMTEQEFGGINDLTDKVVALKQKLRRLRERDAHGATWASTE